MANGTYAGAPDRTLRTEVWYPATSAGRDAAIDASGAPYPLIVHAHGFLDNRVGESYLTQHLASHGYVVAAVDFPLSNTVAPGGATVADIHNQPGDLSFLIDRMLIEFSGTVDPAAIGAEGLSLGGLTTWLVTYHPVFRDARVRAAHAMAAPACLFRSQFFRNADVPRMVLHGDSDAIIPFAENGRRAFRGGGAARHLVQMFDASHTGFSVFATLFDPMVHYDEIGCAAIGAGLGEIDEDDNPFGFLGGPAFGLRGDAARCALPCQDGVPAGPALEATVHHEITRVAATAFFEAHLRDDDAAYCFLAAGVGESGELTRVRTRGGR
jgi:predicted dienelactone hydrolase